MKLSEQEIKAARDAALAALRAAVGADPALKARALKLSESDDFQSLAADPDFVAIVGAEAPTAVPASKAA